MIAGDLPVKWTAAVVSRADFLFVSSHAAVCGCGTARIARHIVGELESKHVLRVEALFALATRSIFPHESQRASIYETS
jgi:hypothetical protein